jgi:predicted RNA methylase
MNYQVEIERDVIEVLAKSRVDTNVLFLPEGQLERKFYERVNKALVMLGGKWNRVKKGHVFGDDPSDLLDNLLLTGVITDSKKKFQFFPTPPAIAKIVCDMAEINDECDVLEPSAGYGHIAKEILKHAPRSVTVVELDTEKAPYLEGKYDKCFVGQDFLTWEPESRFDRIVMNPPFSQKQDIRHILRAFELLKPGGILVSILSPSPFFCSDKLSQTFRDFLDNNRADVSEFEAGTFNESGTNILTKCVRVMKNGEKD